MELMLNRLFVVEYLATRLALRQSDSTPANPQHVTWRWERSGKCWWLALDDGQAKWWQSFQERIPQAKVGTAAWYMERETRHRPFAG